MDMKGEFIKCEIAENLAVVTIERPPVNALSQQVLLELQQVFTDLASKPSVRAVIITGTGDKVFVAGADIDGLKELTPETGEKINQLYQSTFSMIADFPRPVICAVSGMALGGGAELALACDIRIAANSTIFSWPEVNLGLIPGGGGTQRLPRQIPTAIAKELLFTGRRVSASEAEKIGLINQVVPDGETLEAAIVMAQQIIRKGPVAVAQVKQSINRGVDLPLKEAIDLEAELSAICFGTEDFQEGVDAFFNKRKPGFRGR